MQIEPPLFDSPLLRLPVQLDRPGSLLVDIKISETRGRRDQRARREAGRRGGRGNDRRSGWGAEIGQLGVRTGFGDGELRPGPLASLVEFKCGPLDAWEALGELARTGVGVGGPGRGERATRLVVRAGQALDQLFEGGGVGLDKGRGWDGGLWAQPWCFLHLCLLREATSLERPFQANKQPKNNNNKKNLERERERRGRKGDGCGRLSPIKKMAVRLMESRFCDHLATLTTLMI